MELAGSDLEFGRRRSIVAVRAQRTAQYLAGSAGGPQGRGPVDASKANLV